MRFVKTEDLKTGMRIARPIYNKKGVLLYERDTKLTEPGINSIKNFGLIGIFILEPAEPAPPMTDDDIEFERFQTVQVYALEAELSEILRTKKQRKLDVIAASIGRSYGHLNRKINFTQNLRSKDDFVYKHSLNVAILTAMMCHKMNMQVDESNDCLTAALLHDIGKLTISDSLLQNASEMEQQHMYEQGQIQGFELIGNVFTSNPGIKRICAQTQKTLYEFNKQGIIPDKNAKTVLGAKVLMVAETYDSMTAMRFEGEPSSEVEVLRFFTEHPEVFYPKAVEALVNSINILGQGTCVELSNGSKALVLSVNPQNVLWPMVLCFSNNEVMDLSNRRLFDDIEIVDIMKTMDNRYVIDNESIKKYLGV